MGGCIDRPSGISEQASAIIGTQDDVQEIAQRLDDAIDDVAGVSSREVSDAEKRVEKVEEAHTHSKSKEEIAARNTKMTEALIHLEKAKHEAKLRESELRREVWSELEVQYGDNFENHVVEAENGWHQRYIWAT